MNPGDDVDLRLAGPDIDRLRAAAYAVKALLTEYAGVYEISDSFSAARKRCSSASSRRRRPSG